jgi:murein DD-endopeptidase MepM/ murein hydrolase activator NlpD
MLLRRVAVVVVVGAVVLGVVRGPLGAQTAGTDRETRLNAEILEVSAQAAEAVRALEEVRRQKALIDARVAELDSEIDDANAKLVPLDAEVRQLAVELQASEDELAQNEVLLDAAKDEVGRSAAELYRSERGGVAYDVVVASRPADLVGGLKYVDLINARQRQALLVVKRLRRVIEDQRDAINDRKVRAEAAAAEATKLRDQIVALRADVEPARVEAAAQAKAEQDKLALLTAQKADAEHQLAALKAVSDSITALLRSSGSTGDNVVACDRRPVADPIVSGFGPRIDPITGAPSFHPGVDLASSIGTPIHACRSGLVMIAGDQGGYGNAVVIDHGEGMATLYGHQSRVAVQPGQRVEAGDVIGYVGSTGYSSGPHLHFEVRTGGYPIDPAPYL